MLSNATASPKIVHDQEERLTFPVLLSFTPLTTSVQSFLSTHSAKSTGVRTPVSLSLNFHMCFRTKYVYYCPTVAQHSPLQLPQNVHLLTLMDNSLYGANGTLILRLSHLFEAGEDPVLSGPVTVQLDQLVAHVRITSCTEMSVTANQPVRAQLRNRKETTQTFRSQMCIAIPGARTQPHSQRPSDRRRRTSRSICPPWSCGHGFAHTRARDHSSKRTTFPDASQK